MGHLTMFSVLLLSLYMGQGMALDAPEIPEYIGCGATIRGIPEGSINYPNARGQRYPKNQDCTWKIILGEGDRMILNFTRFNLVWTRSKPDDILTIKNGETGTSIGTFDGNKRGPFGGKIPKIMESEANEIFLHFTSDDRGLGFGFEVKWKKIINNGPGNQCPADESDNSAMLQQIESLELAVETMVNKSNDAAKDEKTLLIQELKADLQEMKNKQNHAQTQLQEMTNKQATTLSQLKEIENKQETMLNLLLEMKNKPENAKQLLEEMKNKQDTTQFKLDFIIEQFIGFGCWSKMSNITHPEGFSETHECILYTCTNGKWLPDGPDPDCYDSNTESPISTDGDSMVSADPPFVPTEPPYIPTDPPVIPTDLPVIQTDPPVIPTEPPTDGDSDEESGSDCDYSSTFSASHSMNLPAKAECNIQRTGVSEDEKDTILQKHNELRAKVASGNESPQPAAANMLEMKWNDELAEVAQAWTEQCTFGHDQYDDRKICSEDYSVGQNAYKKWGWSASSDWVGAIQNWYDEVSDMPAVSIVSSFKSPSGPAIGHYTQVVWAETYEVGCGAIYYPEKFPGSETTYPETKIYVCNYGPAGNFLTQPIYEVAASGSDAATNCPNGPSATYSGLCATPIPT